MKDPRLRPWTLFDYLFDIGVILLAVGTFLAPVIILIAAIKYLFWK